MMNNFIGKERVQTEERVSTEEGDFLIQLASGIKSELEDIDCASSYDHVNKIRSALIEELTKKYHHTNHLPILKDMFERNYETLTDHLSGFFEQIEEKKATIIEGVNIGFTKIKEKMNKMQENGQNNLMNNNVNMINYIYDDEFVALINNLSSAIKEFFKNSRGCFGSIKGSADQIVDQILHSKSSISDVLLQVNSCLLNAPNNPKYSQKTISGNNSKESNFLIKEKAIKEKINTLLAKLEGINEMRNNVSKNIKTLEQNCAKFYEEAKVIFKKMKKTRSDKLEEFQIGMSNINQQMGQTTPLASGYSSLTNFNRKNQNNSGGLTQNQNTRSGVSLHPPNNINSRYTSNSPSLRNLVNSNSRGNSKNRNQDYHSVGYNSHSNLHESNNFNITPVSNNHFSSSKIPTNLTNLEKIEKEEKLINERIEQYKKRNQELLSELTDTKKKLVDIKFENICLKEKLEKNHHQDSFSPSLTNFYSNQNNYNSNSSQKDVREKANSVDARKKNLGNNNNNISNQSIEHSQEFHPNSNLESVRANPMSNTGRTVNQVKAELLNIKTSCSSSKTKTTTHSRVPSGTNSKTNTSRPPQMTEKFENNQNTVTEKKLSEMVMNFIDQLANLQENIAKKSSDVPELKKNFELKKRELYRCAEKIKLISPKLLNDNSFHSINIGISPVNNNSISNNHNETKSTFPNKTIRPNLKSSKPQSVSASASSSNLINGPSSGANQVPSNAPTNEPGLIKDIGPSTGSDNIQAKIPKPHHLNKSSNNFIIEMPESVTISPNNRNKNLLSSIESNLIGEIINKDFLNLQNEFAVLQEENAKLNSLLAKMNEELSSKLTEFKSLEDNYEKEKNKNSALETKIKNEKSISLLIEEKLREEKKKNKELEEQLLVRRKSSEKIEYNIEVDQELIKNLEEKLKESKKNLKEVGEKLISTETLMNKMKEDYEKTHHVLREENESTKILLDSYKHSMETYKKDAEERLEEKIKLVEEKENSIIQLKNKLEGHKSQTDIKDKLLVQMKEDKDKHNKIYENLKTNSDLLEQKSKVLEKDKAKLEELIREKDSLIKKLEVDLTKSADKINSEIINLRNKNEILVEDNKKLKESLTFENQQTEEKVGKLKKEIEKLSNDLLISEENLKILKEDLDKNKEIENNKNKKIEILESNLEKLKSSNEEKSIKISTLQETKAKMEDELNLLSEDKNNLQIKLSQLEKKNSEVMIENENVNSEIEKYKSSIMDLENQSNNLHKLLETLKNEKNDLSTSLDKTKIELIHSTELIKVLKEENEMNKKDLHNTASNNEERLREEKSKNRELAEKLLNKDEEISLISQKRDNLEIELSNLKQLVEDLKAEKEKLQKEKEKVSSDMKEIIKNKQSEIKELNKEKDDLEGKLRELHRNIQNLGEQLTSLKQENSKLSKEVTLKQEEGNILEKTLKQMKELQSDYQITISKLNKQLETSEKEKAEFQDELAKLELKLEQTESELKKASNDLQKNVEENSNLIKTLQSEKEEIILKCNKFNEELSQLMREKEATSTNLSDKEKYYSTLITEQKSKIEESSKQIDKLNVSMKEMEAQLINEKDLSKDLQGQIKDLEDKIKDAEHSNEQKISELLNKINDLTNQIKEIDSNKKAKEMEIERLNNNTERVQREYEEYKNEIGAELEKLKEKHLSDLSNLESQNHQFITNLQKEKEQVENSNQIFKAESEELKSEILSLKEDMEKLTNQIEALKKENSHLTNTLEEHLEKSKIELQSQTDLNKLLKEELESHKKDLHNSASTNEERLKEEKQKNRDLNEKLIKLEEEMRTQLNEKESEINRKQKEINEFREREKENLSKIVEITSELEKEKLSVSAEINEKSLLQNQIRHLKDDTHKLDNEIETQKIMINSLNEKNSKEKEKLTNELKTVREQFEAEIKEKEISIVDLQRKINELTSELNIQNEDSENIKQNIKSKEGEIEKIREEFQSKLNEQKGREVSESLFEKEKEIEKLNQLITQYTNKINTYETMFTDIQDAKNGIIEEKKNLESLLKENEEKYNKLSIDYQNSIKESKEVKNKMAQFKNDFNTFNEEKAAEIEKLKITLDSLYTENEKILKALNNLRLKTNTLEGDNKLNVIKAYDEEENTDIISVIDEVAGKLDNIYKRLSEYSKKEAEIEEEKKMVEARLMELNKNADSKLMEFEEENRKLKEVNEEYTKKIMQAVKEKAPYLNVDLKSSSESYLKTIDLFKVYNEELNKINNQLEEKFTKATSKAKKYKELYKSVLSTNTAQVNNQTTYEPEKYKIITDKTWNNLKWVLLTQKENSEKETTFTNTFWVNSDILDLTKFNKYSTENEKNQEISDLLSIQDELLHKLSKKEDEISKLRLQVDKLKAYNSTNTNVNNTNASVSNSNIKSKKESVDFKTLNNKNNSSGETIPLEKYEKLLNTLIEEQEKLRQGSLLIEKLKSDNENLKNILDQNRSKIEKQGNSFSIIKDEKSNGSKFLDDEHELNDIFNANEDNIMGDKHNLSAISIKEGSQIQKTSEKIKSSNNVIDDNADRKSSLNSFRTGRRNETQTSVKDSYKENIHKLEENEKLFNEQLKGLKDELKETRAQRDVYKRKYEESISLQDDKKTQLMSMLKQAFEKLIYEIQITAKVKEYVNMILKILDYNEADISRIVNKKDKDKKGFLGLFNKK